MSIRFGRLTKSALETEPLKMPRCFWSEEDNGFIAVDDLRPGCSAFGKTSLIAKCELFEAATAWDEAKKNADAAQAHQEAFGL